jgi:Leucine-rich repeat (LRR) protein
MKKLTFICLLFAGFAKSQNIIINTTNFPDANFRSYLLSRPYGSDGIITPAEINGITLIEITNGYIYSLEGIGFFTNLENLNCYNNQLTTLDVSNNLNLKYLMCSGNQLTSLEVSNNSALKSLWCESNQLTTLDVSNNSALESLWCDGNQFTTLDVSNNPDLYSLYCSKNQLTTLDVSNNLNLKYLICSNNQFTTLDVSNNPNLYSLYCYNNQFTSLNFSNNPNLKFLYCENNQQLTSLFMKNGINITYYTFTNTPNLSFICCNPNQLAEIKNYVTTNHIGNNPVVTSDCLLSTQETSKNKIYIYPNPVKDILTIENGKLKVENAKIYDMNGKLVKTFTENSVNVSDLQKGNYILNIDNQSFKFIKQ